MLTNADLERMVETSDQSIVDRTGIRERRIAAEDQSAASLGAEAGKMALKTAGLLPDDIDLIICATCSPDGMFPSTASLIQDAIGARRAGAFDVNAACTGFITALATGTQFINAGVYQRVMVVGAEVFSASPTGPTAPPASCLATAPAPSSSEQGESGGAGSFVLKSDGAAANSNTMRGRITGVSLFLSFFLSVHTFVASSCS